MNLFNPAEPTRLHHDAVMLRTRAAAVRHRAASLAWQGAAGDAFRHAAHDLATRLDSCADDFDEAARWG